MAVSKYMIYLSQFRNFKLVVFLDSQERFVAYMPSWAFKNLNTLPELGDEFLGIINNGRINDLYNYMEVEKETIFTKSTNIEALQLMTKVNLEALVVIDEDRKLKGVIEREQVISKLILTLVK
jgi:CBS domain-containing protein